MRTMSPAEYMDQKYPGWEDRVNLETVDMQDSTMCIAGQASGGDGTAWSRAFDFFRTIDGFGGFDDFHPFASQKAIPYWREEIAKRRLAKLPVEVPEPEHELVLV